MESSEQSGWFPVTASRPPSGKLMFYTIGGTTFIGHWSDDLRGFSTHWRYLPARPGKPAGTIPAPIPPTEV